MIENNGFPASRRIAATLAFFVCIGLSVLAQSGGRVRIGYCGPLSDIDAVKAAGFDYFEVRTTEVAALSDADFEKLVARLKGLALPVFAAYQFLPGDLKVTGPAVNEDRQGEYLARALSRVGRLGAHVIVFGSSGARNVPDGFDKKKAFAQLVDFGKRAGPLARAQNIIIAIEPQRRVESNIINNVGEALAWVEAVNDPNIQLMIDYYHFSIEKEDPAVIAKVGSHLRHIHMANPDNRVMPLNWAEFDYAPFFAALRGIGYNRQIGLEASTQDLKTDGPRTIALLRHAMGE